MMTVEMVELGWGMGYYGISYGVGILEVQNKIGLMANQLKEGSVATYRVMQNTTVYQVRLTNTAKGLWMCIEESGLNWKLTISPEMIEQTVSKASASKQNMNLKEFTTSIMQAISRTSEKWGVGIMTPVELEVLRGGVPTKQANNNKIYLILSDKEKKFHYPFTFVMSELGQKQKLLEAIKTMKCQLQQLRVERTDKSHSSFSIMSEKMNAGDQVRMENQQMKKKIRMYEQSLTQKRGAVEIDQILKQKNTLEIQSETKKREENKEITRLKNVHHLMEREIHEIENELELINREMLMLEDSVGTSAKIKSHAMKVLRSYETQLRTQKKVLQKQTREIDNLKRNIQTSKNGERRVLGKIKQIQLEIDQCKKKTNINEISNRLHSVGRGKGSNVDSASSKSQSVGGSSAAGGKVKSDTSSKKGPVNLVRQNILRKNMPLSSSNRNNNLLRTSPNIVSTDLRKTSSDKLSGSGRAINSSHQAQKYPGVGTGTNARLFNTQKYRSGSKSQNESSVRSDSAKKEMTKQEKEKQRNAMNRLAGPRATLPKGPSAEKKTQTGIRGTSQTRGSSINRGALSSKEGSLSKPGAPQGGSKKDSAKDLLMRMKQIKAHYSGKANQNATTSKHIVAEHRS